MPWVAAIFLATSVLAGLVLPSYGFYDHDVLYNESLPVDISSGILEIPPTASQKSELKRYLIFGQDIPDYAKQHSFYNGFFSVELLPENSATRLRSNGYLVIEDFMLEFDKTPEASRIGTITDSEFVRNELGYNGSGVTIAIIDTGIDFSNPDIGDSLLRDEKNHPVMLDADGQGIIITNTTFYATIEDGILRNTRTPPSDVTSSVYVNRDGVFLNVNQDGRGTEIPIYNSLFPLAGEGPVFNGRLVEDMKIGDNNRNYIKSQSGYYHLGMMYQGALTGQYARLQVVPVLVTDPNIAGVYDTIIPDMSTSWEDYTRFDLPIGQQPDYDFDFTDEKPIVLGSGNEFLVYDSDGDGRIDYSAGAVGAMVLDVYGVIQNRTSTVLDNIGAVNGTLLSPIDPDGNYFGVMTDFEGHGTSSAASIVSRGVNTYDVYNNTKQYNIVGIAPGAKILPVKTLWFGDTVYSWLWAAGFENYSQQWQFSGKLRTDIISNSWGASNFPNLGSAPGLDVMSLILTVLTVPHSIDDNYPGVVTVVSAGNSGPGYGTMATPNLSPFAISVGATTNNVFVGYGPFAKEPRFGSTTDHLNHVVDFSSRGPGIIGDPKPDIMSIGAHSFVPSSMLRLEKSSDKEPFSLFGGTSMAAPLVAGGAAILIEALRDIQIDHDPFLVKNILMSTAGDIYNDALTQGAGMINVKNAVKLVKDKDVFFVYNDGSYENIKEILEPAIAKINATEINVGRFELPHKSFEMMSWFGGHLYASQRTTTTFTIENPTDETINVSIRPQTLDLIKSTQFSGTTEVKLQDRILNKKDSYRPNYIPLSDVREFSDLGSFFDDGEAIPKDADLLILNLHFPFEEFMNKTNDIYAEDLQISSLYVYDWIDGDNNTRITSDELSMVSRGGSWGTVQELRISEPASKFEGTPIVGIYPVPTKFSFWIGNSGNDAVSMEYTLTASYYKKNYWEPIWVDKNSITIEPDSSGTVEATIVVPVDYDTGVYHGFLKFESSRHTVNVPTSFVVKEPVLAETSILVPGIQSESTIHSPGFVKGAFDMTNRYMAGDWRQYYFDIRDPSINVAAVELSWEHKDTNLAVFVVDPIGKIIQTNVPSGVFGHFMNWPSLDWLGTSPFSQGGGFFPTKNKDETSTVLYIPINQTGTHSLLIHSTLFAGVSTTEPVTMSALFTTINRDPSPVIDLSLPDIIDNNTIVRPQILDDNLKRVIFFANYTQLFLKDGELDLTGLDDGFYILTITASDTEQNYSTKSLSFTKITTQNKHVPEPYSQASSPHNDTDTPEPYSPEPRPHNDTDTPEPYSPEPRPHNDTEPQTAFITNYTGSQDDQEKLDNQTMTYVLYVAVIVVIAVATGAGIFIKLGDSTKTKQPT